MREERSPIRYTLLQPISAVKLEEHPGSTLRNPTGNLVKIPANVTLELEGGVPPSGLVTVLWNGNAFSVFYEDLKENARSLSGWDRNLMRFTPRRSLPGLFCPRLLVQALAAPSRAAA